jgi:hypothetical protein
MLKLSEAMRLGAMLSPQGFSEAGDGRCALQSAGDAEGITSITSDGWPATPYMQLTARWPILGTQRGCPLCSWGRAFDDDCVTRKVIWHLNDTHRWTREQIADWVQTIEDAQVVSERPRADQAVGVLAAQARETTR